MTPSDKEPMMDDDRLVLAEVKTLVGTIREDIHEMREELRRSNENKVTRLEWAQRNDTVDQRFGKQGEEISEIKQTMATREEVAVIRKEIASRRVPVTAWVAVVLAALSLGWVIFGPVLTNSQ